MGQTVFTASNATWPTPTDWNNAANFIEGIAGGAGGQDNASGSGNGGGGGAYGKAINQTLSANPATNNITVGANGTGGTGGGNATAGGATSFKNTGATTLMSANPGQAGSGATQASGGTAGTGSTTAVGGKGSLTNAIAAGGGGGGAGGPNGAGATGGSGGGTTTGSGGGGGGAGGGGAGGTGTTSSPTTGAAGGTKFGGGGGGIGGIGTGASEAADTGGSGTGGGGGGGGGAGTNGFSGDGGIGSTENGTTYTPSWGSSSFGSGGGGGGGGGGTGAAVGGAAGSYGGGGGGGNAGSNGGAGGPGIAVVSWTGSGTVHTQNNVFTAYAAIANTSWNPGQLTGCIGFWTAANGVVSNSTGGVTQWLDQSASGHNLVNSIASGVSLTQTFNGKFPCLTFANAAGNGGLVNSSFVFANNTYTVWFLGANASVNLAALNCGLMGIWANGATSGDVGGSGLFLDVGANAAGTGLALDIIINGVGATFPTGVAVGSLGQSQVKPFLLVFSSNSTATHLWYNGFQFANTGISVVVGNATATQSILHIGYGSNTTAAEAYGPYLGQVAACGVLNNYLVNANDVQNLMTWTSDQFGLSGPNALANSVFTTQYVPTGLQKTVNIPRLRSITATGQINRPQQGINKNPLFAVSENFKIQKVVNATRTMAVAKAAQINKLVTKATQTFSIGSRSLIQKAVNLLPFSETISVLTQVPPKTVGIIRAFLASTQMQIQKVITTIPIVFPANTWVANTTWTPALIPNTTFFLSAANGVVNTATGGVTQWTDQSGHGENFVNAQATSGGIQWSANAFNGYPGVKFSNTAAGQWLVNQPLAFDTATTMSIWALVANTTGTGLGVSANPGLFDLVTAAGTSVDTGSGGMIFAVGANATQGNSAVLVYTGSGGGAFETGPGGTTATTLPQPNTQPLLIGFTMNGANATTWYQGQSYFSYTSGGPFQFGNNTPSNVTAYIGVRGTPGNTQPFTGTVMAMGLVGNYAMTQTDWSNLLTWASLTYGLDQGINQLPNVSANTYAPTGLQKTVQPTRQVDINVYQSPLGAPTPILPTNTAQFITFYNSGSPTTGAQLTTTQAPANTTVIVWFATTDNTSSNVTAFNDSNGNQYNVTPMYPTPGAPGNASLGALAACRLISPLPVGSSFTAVCADHTKQYAVQEAFYVPGIGSVPTVMNLIGNNQSGQNSISISSHLTQPNNFAFGMWETQASQGGTWFEDTADGWITYDNDTVDTGLLHAAYNITNTTSLSYAMAWQDQGSYWAGFVVYPQIAQSQITIQKTVDPIRIFSALATLPNYGPIVVGAIRKFTTTTNFQPSKFINVARASINAVVHFTAIAQHILAKIFSGVITTATQVPLKTVGVIRNHIATATTQMQRSITKTFTYTMLLGWNPSMIPSIDLLYTANSSYITANGSNKVLSWTDQIQGFTVNNAPSGGLNQSLANVPTFIGNSAAFPGHPCVSFTANTQYLANNNLNIPRTANQSIFTLIEGASQTGWTSTTDPGIMSFVVVGTAIDTGVNAFFLAAGSNTGNVVAGFDISGIGFGGALAPQSTIPITTPLLYIQTMNGTVSNSYAYGGNTLITNTAAYVTTGFGASNAALLVGTRYSTSPTQGFVGNIAMIGVVSGYTMTQNDAMILAAWSNINWGTNFFVNNASVSATFIAKQIIQNRLGTALADTATIVRQTLKQTVHNVLATVPTVMKAVNKLSNSLYHASAIGQPIKQMQQQPKVFNATATSQFPPPLLAKLLTGFVTITATLGQRAITTVTSTFTAIAQHLIQKTTNKNTSNQFNATATLPFSRSNNLLISKNPIFNVTTTFNLFQRAITTVVVIFNIATQVFRSAAQQTGKTRFNFTVHTTATNLPQFAIERLLTMVMQTKALFLPVAYSKFVQATVSTTADLFNRVLTVIRSFAATSTIAINKNMIQNPLNTIGSTSVTMARSIATTWTYITDTTIMIQKTINQSRVATVTKTTNAIRNVMISRVLNVTANAKALAQGLRNFLMIVATRARFQRLPQVSKSMIISTKTFSQKSTGVVRNIPVTTTSLIKKIVGYTYTSIVHTGVTFARMLGKIVKPIVDTSVSIVKSINAQRHVTMNTIGHIIKQSTKTYFLPMTASGKVIKSVGIGRMGPVVARAQSLGVRIVGVVRTFIPHTIVTFQRAIVTQPITFKAIATNLASALKRPLKAFSAIVGTATTIVRTPGKNPIFHVIPIADATKSVGKNVKTITYAFVTTFTTSRVVGYINVMASVVTQAQIATLFKAYLQKIVARIADTANTITVTSIKTMANTIDQHVLTPANTITVTSIKTIIGVGNTINTRVLTPIKTIVVNAFSKGN